MPKAEENLSLINPEKKDILWAIENNDERIVRSILSLDKNVRLKSNKFTIKKGREVRHEVLYKSFFSTENIFKEVLKYYKSHGKELPKKLSITNNGELYKNLDIITAVSFVKPRNDGEPYDDGGVKATFLALELIEYFKDDDLLLKSAKNILEFHFKNLQKQLDPETSNEKTRQDCKKYETIAIDILQKISEAGKPMQDIFKGEKVANYALCLISAGSTDLLSKLLDAKVLDINHQYSNDNGSYTMIDWARDQNKTGALNILNKSAQGDQPSNSPKPTKKTVNLQGEREPDLVI